MVSKSYLQGKINNVQESIGFIAGRSNPADCAMLYFLTNTTKDAIDNAAHHTGDLTPHPECSETIRLLVMQLRSKFVEVKEYVKPSVLNDINWCLDRLACIIVELPPHDDGRDADADVHYSESIPEDSDSPDPIDLSQKCDTSLGS